MFRRWAPKSRDGEPTSVADPAVDVEEIRASGLFDAEGYLAANPDVAAAGVDPIAHYLAAGAAEGRRPGPGFDAAWYLGETPEAGLPGVNPLLHYLRHGRALGRTPLPLDEGQGFDSFLAGTRAGRLPFAEGLRARFDRVHYALDPCRRPPDGAPLPLPPVELSARIGSPTLDGFEEIGRGVKEAIVRCLPAGFDFTASRCLDFGCGVGRVIRHFAAEARSAEFWGSDIDGTSIRWAVEALSPPFRFYQMSQSPALPFEDSSFDLVYAVGVFSQVYDDWHQWAVEIRRVLKPGGTFFMSYAGQTPFEEMLSLPYADHAANPGLYVKNPFNAWNRGGPMVFMSPAWVERHWGSLFDIDFVAPDALLDYQSICVMRKPRLGAPPRPGMRVAETATRQGFNPDAAGKILAAFDPSKPFLDSYGIEASGAATVRGWTALRGDEADRIELTVDGDPVPHGPAVWGVGAPYRDWEGARETAFEVAADLSGASPGRHRLGVRIVGRRGVVHEMSIPLHLR